MEGQNRECSGWEELCRYAVEFQDLCPQSFSHSQRMAGGRVETVVKNVLTAVASGVQQRLPVVRCLGSASRCPAKPCLLCL